MQFIYSDGGRQAAGFSGQTSDCVCRALSIATGLPYLKVYNDINTLSQSERKGKRRSGRTNARTGVYTTSVWFKEYMRSLGWKFVACMTIGSGCKVHLRDGELPMGRLICKVSKHYVAVIDGVMHDVYDPSRNGKRCIYGYWIKA